MKKDYSILSPIVGQAVKIIEAAHSNTGGLTGISTGFYKLDDMTCGWQKSDLVIIAGRPAMGKTAFALSLAKNIAIDQGIPMAFFSLEMSDVQLANRLLSNVCEIEGKKLMSGQLDREDWNRLDKNLSALTENAPLFIDDTEGLSVMELRSKARRMIKYAICCNPSISIIIVPVLYMILCVFLRVADGPFICLASVNSYLRWAVFWMSEDQGTSQNWQVKLVPRKMLKSGQDI